nr:lipoprotein [Alteromonas sp. 76-1]
MTFTAILLSGCGYKGALYIPQAPEQTTPTEKPDETVSSPNTQSQPASTPGESH